MGHHETLSVTRHETASALREGMLGTAKVGGCCSDANFVLAYARSRAGSLLLRDPPGV